MHPVYMMKFKYFSLHFLYIQEGHDQADTGLYIRLMTGRIYKHAKHTLHNTTLSCTVRQPAKFRVKSTCDIVYQPTHLHTSKSLKNGNIGARRDLPSYSTCAATEDLQL